jgi:3-oxoacyl-[acyl-carrier protein] reductase
MTARRVALIQHAGTYVGPALARRLARSGHDLVLHLPRADQIEELTALGAAVEVIDADAVGVTGDQTAEGAQAMVDRALARFGRLDSAALSPSRGPGPSVSRVALMEAPLELVEAITGYFHSTYHLLRAIIPAMRGQGGQILVFTSDAGARPEAGWSLYGASRAGQNFLIQAVALEHAAEGICLNALGSKNAVFEGFPYSPPGATTDFSVTYGEWSKGMQAETPLGRLGTMEELAAFAAVLLDGTNRFQTAQVFNFSGGWHAK